MLRSNANDGMNACRYVQLWLTLIVRASFTPLGVGGGTTADWLAWCCSEPVETQPLTRRAEKSHFQLVGPRKLVSPL